MSETMAERVDAVFARIDATCAEHGRDPAEVTVVAVSKKKSPEEVAEAANLGLSTMGENRIQEAAQKIPLCSGGIEWHFVGHLQTNKARHAAVLFRAIHSIDAAHTLEALEAACDVEGARMQAFLQVNIAGEAQKYGVAPDAAEAVLEAAFTCTRIDVCGLMTMPPFTEDPAASQPHFAALRALRDRLEARTGARLPGLSMGMSRDYPWAIAEGATHLRLGTALFGPRGGARA